MSAKTSEQRKQLLARWVTSTLSETIGPNIVTPLQSIGGDAGFRRYYRVQSSQGTHIAVDAPPETEDNEAFIHIARVWRQQGISVPEVRAIDFTQGFMLQEDFGDTLLQTVLTHENADVLYHKAFDTLRYIQQQPSEGLPEQDESLLHYELSLYPTWFLQQLMGLGDDIPRLAPLFSTLSNSVLEQPKGTVHRDFHSRNLMILPEERLGVIDFQGALYGSLLYDLASLLKDCYIDWPQSQVDHWMLSFTHQHKKLKHIDRAQLRFWFDMAGLQRHLKCLGIFSRLWLRDDKPNYLVEIPRVLNYVLTVCHRYPELKKHAEWLEKHVKPILSERLKEVTEKTSTL